MARYSGSPFGKISGKLGEVVGASWKGIKVVRTYQPVVGNPRTLPQRMQRAKFRELSALGKAMGTILKLGFRNYTQSLTAQNVFMSRNKDATTGATPETIMVDGPEIIVSDGDLRPVAALQVTSNTATQIDFTWNENLGGNALSDDFVAVVVYNQTQSLILSVEEDFQRDDLGGNTQGMEFVAGDQIYLYAFAHNGSTGKVSKTLATTYLAV